MWKLASRTSVSIDLGSENIKIVCLRKKRNESELMFCGFFPKTQTEIISEILKNPHLKHASIRVVLKDSLVRMRQLELPPAPPEDLDQMAKMAISQYLTGPAEEHIIRYNLKQKVAFIAEKKQINDYLSKLQSLGIPNPEILEPRMNCLAHAANYNHPLKKDQCSAIVDIGKSMALLAFYSEDGLIFGRNLSESAGINLFGQIAEHLKIETNDAYAKQSEPGFLSLKNPDTKDALVRWFCKVAVELQNSIESYQIQFPQDKVSQLLITGGSSVIPGLATYVQDVLKIPTTPLKTFSNISISGFPGIDFKSQEHYYAAAVGLAL